ncbi:MAG: hypothetical protein ACRDQF_20800, partial [Thermocrispum sp.]
LYAGAAAVLVSFFALTVFRVKPKLRGGAAGRTLPAGLRRLADARATRVVLRAAGVLLLVVLLAASWFGTDSAATNPAATWFYVWFWFGLVPLALLFGPVWRLVNPLRALAAALRPLLPNRQLPHRIGYWSATAGVLVFLWLELVFADSANPRAIAVFVTVYAVLHAVAGAVYGPRWFDTGDAFEVYFGLIGRLAPIGRRDDGRLVLRNPLDGLLTIPRARGLTTVVLVVLGSTAFDGLTRLSVWSDLTGDVRGLPLALLGTAGLLFCIAGVAGVYTGGIWLTKPYLRRSATHDGFGQFAHALVPIMVGYTVAHYFSFAVFQGQAGWLLATDPFGLGWDLLGTGGIGALSIDYTVASTTAIALVQVGAIVLGHVIGVTSAHDRAIGIVRGKYVRVGQYPMLAAMVVFTATGIALVSGG